MGKKLEGHDINAYAGTFQGSFDLSEEEGSEINYDDMVCLVVVATTGAPKFTPLKDGLKETYAFKPNSIKVVDNEIAKKILVLANIQVPGVTDEVAEIPPPDPYNIMQDFIGDSYA